jgi:hypothetical protein
MLQNKAILRGLGTIVRSFLICMAVYLVFAFLDIFGRASISEYLWCIRCRAADVELFSALPIFSGIASFRTAGRRHGGVLVGATLVSAGFMMSSLLSGRHFHKVDFIVFGFSTLDYMLLTSLVFFMLTTVLLFIWKKIDGQE